MVYFIFFIFFIFFALLGMRAGHHAKNTSKDYYLADSNVSPLAVAISSLATSNSGFMFTGMFGYAWVQGLSAYWLLLGWCVGELIFLTLCMKKIRVSTEEQNHQTYSMLISNWYGENQIYIRKISSILILIFLSLYAAAQLVAGGKILNLLLNIPYSYGVFLGFAIVLFYCYNGGVRASIWTDCAQFMIMFFSVSIVLVLGLSHIGGISLFMQELSRISPDYASIFPHNKGGFFFISLFILGWVSAGLGISGQAHVVTRFMMIDKIKNIKKTLIYYISISLVFGFIVTITALLAKIILLDVATGFDPEMALPELVNVLLPSFMGVVLASIFAATISTADSQILTCSAGLSKDLFSNKNVSIKQIKICTVVVATCALIVALQNNPSIFQLVLMSWSGLASAFTPLIILKACGKNISQRTGIIMMLTGFISSILWRCMGFSPVVYETFIGILLGFIVFFLSRIKSCGKSGDIKILDTNGVNFYLQKLISNAKEKIILMSPYLQLNPQMLKLIESKSNLITIICRQDKINKYTLSKLKDILKSNSIVNRQTLHAKCYINESAAIITSMNLYEFSQLRNDEMGIYITKKNNPSVYQKVYEQVMRYSEKQPISTNLAQNPVSTKKKMSAAIHLVKKTPYTINSLDKMFDFEYKGHSTVKCSSNQKSIVLFGYANLKNINVVYEKDGVIEKIEYISALIKISDIKLLKYGNKFLYNAYLNQDKSIYVFKDFYFMGEYMIYKMPVFLDNRWVFSLQIRNN